ncbi:MAG TPA: ABC transporter substrate-binding protein [Chloroflexota bacterium]|nr:ABC transporter substrate-binding protein [Chloroflexota bacterium]
MNRKRDVLVQLVSVVLVGYLVGCSVAPSGRPAGDSALPARGPGAEAERAAAPAAAPPNPPVTVKFGDLPATSNAGIYIAQARGYFHEEGLEVVFETFDSFERSIPMLATGQIDAAGGGVNAAMFSAIGRGLPLKIVAGISRNEPGYSSSALVVRKDLIDTGRVRDYADLRGMRLSLLSKTSGLGAEFHRVLELGGLTEADIDLKLLPFPDAALALANGAIDASIMTEPFVARVVQSGVGVRWKGADEIYPWHQLTVLLYSPQFISNREAAVRFLVAYLRGARDYTAMIKGGEDPTPLYQILAEYTPIKDLSIYPVMRPSGIDPNGALNRESLEADQELWASQGHIPQRADLATAIDLQYLEAALQRLGGPR